MNTKELLRSHTSVRKYTGEEISKETVIDLIETAQMAASSHFVQAYSVIWITDEEKKTKIWVNCLKTNSNSKQAVPLSCLRRFQTFAGSRVKSTESIFLLTRLKTCL